MCIGVSGLDEITQKGIATGLMPSRNPLRMVGLQPIITTLPKLQYIKEYDRAK